jgi:hypothetical protein
MAGPFDGRRKRDSNNCISIDDLRGFFAALRMTAMTGPFDGRRKRMEEERETTTTAKAKDECGGSSLRSE